MSEKKKLFRVSFVNQNQVYDVFARKVYQSELYGFVVIEELVFDSKTELVIDPGEEKLRDEFSEVKRSFVPMHSIIRIDEVCKTGKVTITDLGDNIKMFPGNLYSAGKGKPDTK